MDAVLKNTFISFTTDIKLSGIVLVKKDKALGFLLIIVQNIMKNTMENTIPNISIGLNFFGGFILIYGNIILQAASL